MQCVEMTEGRRESKARPQWHCGEEATERPSLPARPGASPHGAAGCTLHAPTTTDAQGMQNGVKPPPSNSHPVPRSLAFPHPTQAHTASISYRTRTTTASIPARQSGRRTARHLPRTAPHRIPAPKSGEPDRIGFGVRRRRDEARFGSLILLAWKQGGSRVID